MLEFTHVMTQEIDYNALGQALDTSWGRASTPASSTYSVKFKMMGANYVVANYAVIVNFASEREMILTKRSCNEEAQRILKEVVKHIKASYKELSDKTLTMKQVNVSDSVEIIASSGHNPRRTAYYRFEATFEIG